MYGKGDSITAFKNWQHSLQRKFKVSFFIAQYFIKKFLFVFKSRAPRLKRSYTHNFPAVHMKVDGWQYASMFSSEFLVVVAAIIVAGFNMYFLKMAHGSDDSLTMALLRNHSNFNDQLVLQNNTVRTVVVRPGFVQQAYAEEFRESGDVATDDTDAVYKDSFMFKQNPNSIQELVSKQVTIYETKSGDTISTIAQEHGVSIDSIAWSNNLSKNAPIRPGWFFVIPPYNGIVYKITDSNTTVPDLAKLYNVTTESIVSGNGLAGPDQMPEVGQFLIIKDGKVTPPPAPKASAQAGAKATTQATNRLIVAKGSHKFPYGYCTEWASQQYGGVMFGGNAQNWMKNAKAAGYSTGKIPKKGSIVQTTESRIGHVAYVTGVSADGSTFTISEKNYAGWNKVSYRTLSTNSKVVVGFIY